MTRLHRMFFLAVLTVSSAPAALADRLELAPFAPTVPKELTVPRASERFDPSEALNGSFSSSMQCAGIPGGLWVEVDDKGDCIRSYAHRLSNVENPKVLVYFSGDVILKTKGAIRFVSPSYERRFPDAIGADMARWSEQAGLPAVFLARPGMYGSSGDHNRRRELHEVKLIERALDVLKRRHRISSFILTGQSGGGHIVASLLNRRRDVSAAVITSGLLSMREVTDYWDKRRTVHSSQLQTLYDPIDHISGIRTDPKPVIFVLSDMNDRVVPYPSQLTYVRRLKENGFEPHHVLLTAADKSHHVLTRAGRRAAALIAQGQPASDVRAALETSGFQNGE